MQSGTSDLWIGSRENLAYTLNGTIDELRIYNYSLSANQIKTIYENKTNTIVSDETTTGDSYKCEVTPYDGKEDGESINSTELLILGLPDDPHKYYHKNSLGEVVAWMGTKGNIVLKGKCFFNTTCDNPGDDSFIIRNESDYNLGFINSTGDLCVEKGDCSDQSTNCNSPADGAFIIANSTNYVSYIDGEGDLCLTGKLYENSDP